MQGQSNEQIVRQYVDDVWNKRNTAMINQLLAPNFVAHEPDGDHSLNDGQQLVNEVLSASSDIHFTIDTLTTQGDQVTFQWTGSGRHSGQYQGKPPTGKQISATGTTIVRIVNGKIVEATNQYDRQGILDQL